MQPARGRILVVDDHPRNVSILKKILKDAYQVATAASGEEALAIAPAFAPDIALLDIMMPGIDGYETCRRFRAMPLLADTKIIMVSAMAMVSERLAGYQAGADDYVIKPFDDDELLAKLRVYMRLKKVEEVDRLKTDILTLLSHEARTPLTTVLTPIEMVLDDKTLSAESRELLEMAQYGATRMNDFVVRLVFLSQLHAGLVEFDVKAEDLTAVVRDSVERMHPLAAATGVSLAMHLTGPLVADIDAGQIRQIVEALLKNAVRHSPRGASVEVSLEPSGGSACLTVTDHGPGIPADFLPRVFDGMAVPDITQHHDGAGLSLVIARAVVRRHEGTISAENGSRDGAVFTLNLPLIRAAEEVSTDPPGLIQARDR